VGVAWHDHCQGSVDEKVLGQGAIMRKFVIMGVQGSGKGTQAKLLGEDLDLEHISVGDILRWNVQHHTKLGAQVRRIVASGRLVGDEMVAAVVRQRLSEHDWNFGFIIDGFPRSAAQAEFFLESYDIDGVINLDLPDVEVHRRVLARRLCSQCGLDYNLIAHRPVVDDVCDVCGGQLAVRDDDNPDALAIRLAEYHAQTKPLIELFQRKEFVATIDATFPVFEVQVMIREHFALPPLEPHRP
jgi:adenylate kinase